MTDEAILKALWDEKGANSFPAISIHRIRTIDQDQRKRALQLLRDFTDKPTCPVDGIRITRLGAGVYKFIRTDDTPKSSESPKGLPLTDQNETVTGESESDFPSADEENGQIGTNDLYPAVPEQLKALRQWVMWVYKTREGKTTKVPRQVNGDKNAKSNDPQTWSTFASVVKHEHKRKGRHRIFAGISFAFSSRDPYCGIDLDDCIDDNGNIKPWAQPIVDKLKTVSYGEVSPSGKGVKFWTHAKFPPRAKHKAYIVDNADAIEVYDSGRFFTVTGKGKGSIADGQSTVDWLVTEYLTPQPMQPLSRNPSTDNRSADEVISDIRASKQCHKFDALMAGNTTGYGSQSEADQGLCSLIAFWTQDPTVIDAIFRQSTLMRTKWDEPHRTDKTTYGQMTIETALSEDRETYTPRRHYSRSLAAAARRNL